MKLKLSRVGVCRYPWEPLKHVLSVQLQLVVDSFFKASNSSTKVVDGEDFEKRYNRVQTFLKEYKRSVET